MHPLVLRISTATVACACFALSSPSTAGEVITVPARTALEVRISTPVGSRVSKAGDRVTADIIAPVIAGDRQILLEDAEASGQVDSVQPLGLGLKHGIARVDFHFDSLTLFDGRRYAISGKVREVESARERVDEQGDVDGILPTANLSSGISFAISTLLLHTELTAPAAIVKVIVARSPDSEIYLPVGTELVIELEKPLSIEMSGAVEKAVPPLSQEDTRQVETLLTHIPVQQTMLGAKRSSDLINIMLLGSSEQVDAAFERAGWTGENKRGVMALYRIYRGLIQRTSYSMAPMAPLTLNGVPATRTYQKSLDTIAKRHHVRLWEQDNADAWLAAASEDIGLTIHRMHLTHAIDLDIDNERAKVVNDLWFTGCVDAASLLPRRSLRVVAHGRSPLATDGDIAVLRLRNCDAPPSSSERTTERMRAAEAFEAAAMDIARANPVTVGLLSFRSIAEYRRRSRGSGPPRRWRRPNVLEPAPPANGQQPARQLQAYEAGHGDGLPRNRGE